MKLIQATTEKDLLKIKALAMSIWPEVYKDIIPDEQIYFLLDKYFSVKGMDKYVKEGYQYYFVMQNGEVAGFTSYKDNSDFIYLDKLYLKQEYRHQSLGKEVFTYLKTSYKKKIMLNVNQANRNAISAYLASGFKVVGQQSIPLNDTLVNKDYVMEMEA